MPSQDRMKGIGIDRQSTNLFLILPDFLFEGRHDKFDSSLGRTGFRFP